MLLDTTLSLTWPCEGRYEGDGQDASEDETHDEDRALLRAHNHVLLVLVLVVGCPFTCGQRQSQS